MSDSENTTTDIEENTINTVKIYPDVDVPNLNISFDTLDDAYDWYNTYARTAGFSIKKLRTAKDHYKIHVRELVLSCNRQGLYTKKDTPQKQRAQTRVGCKASCKVKPSEFGKFIITEFEAAHTHDLVPPEQRHLMRSQRKIRETQSRLMKDMRSAGIGPTQINSYMVGLAGGAENLSFTKSDLNNHLSKQRKDILIDGDVQTLSKWFLKKQQKDSHFFYDFWHDADKVVRGVFFCDARCRREYGLFGDAICFDTTFNTNKYGMVCAPIVGVNNHWQTTVFGCGLLEGENTEAVAWVLTSFLKAMGGKMPTTIFTDQSAAIASAIERVLPNSHHRLCLWHIFQNAAKHLSSTFSKYPDVFLNTFQSLNYTPETVEEFEYRWGKMLVKFNLGGNEWLEKMWTVREKWIQVFGRQYFCAGMTTIQRSESMNKFLKKYFPTTTILMEFVQSYERAMKDRREKVTVIEHRNRQSAPIVFGNWAVEKEASQVYTLKLFDRFQEQLKQVGELQLKFELEYDGIYMYKVHHLTKIRKIRMVTWNKFDQSICCTCLNFEFEGILCCHALVVLLQLRITSLPPRYYLKRWSKAISDEIYIHPNGEIFMKEVDPTMAEDYNELSHMTQNMVAMSLLSKPRVMLAKEGVLELTQRISAIKIDEAPTNGEEDNEENI